MLKGLHWSWSLTKHRKRIRQINTPRQNDLDIFTRIIHLGLVIFGLLAWSTGEWADRYYYSSCKGCPDIGQIPISEKIGKSRIEHIVSNKHRRAYERAAQVLGSLAEAYAAMGQKSKAVKILHKYYNEKYNRFSAFRKEVKTVVANSELLRNTGFI